MKRIELELDEQTLERARRLAHSRRCTVEQLLKEMFEHLRVAETTTDPFLGMFAQEPQIVDELIESAMTAREAHPLKLSSG
jgi:hypothetical protein